MNVRYWDHLHVFMIESQNFRSFGQTIFSDNSGNRERIMLIKGKERPAIEREQRDNEANKVSKLGIEGEQR